MVHFNSISLLFLFSTTITCIFQKNLWVVSQCGKAERWAWSDHTCEEQDEFLDAVYELRERGVYDQFIMVHRDMNDWYHGTAEFLPWHRWFIHQFEQALRTVSNNPCITIPYWD